MPAAVAIAVRYIIIAAVQLGLWSLIEKYGIPLINKALEAIMKFFGVAEDVAKDIMSNEILLAFEKVGIFAVTLRTKLPVKVAERLGFTTKGFQLRKLNPSLETKIKQATTAGTTAAASTAGAVETIAQAVSASKGLNVQSVRAFLEGILSYAGKTAIWFMVIANFIDFGNWQGAYQKTFQKLFTAFGFPPDTPLPSAKVVSADTWKRIYATVEELKPIGISFPFSGKDTPYSRANLAALIDEIAANIVKAGGQATYKSVIAIALPLVQLQTAAMAAAGTSAPAAPTISAAAAPQLKVVTGIVSQGVLAPATAFTPRENDLIESSAELQQAAMNNLAPFIAALPGKIVYEIKIVNSVVTKDGFERRGSVQQVVVGTYANGAKKYKTVVNKFAVMTLYIMTDKGSRTKIGAITLGPIDSVQFQPKAAELSQLESSIKSNLSSSAMTEIRTIAPTGGAAEGAADTIVPNVSTTTATGGAAEGAAAYEDTGYRFYKTQVNGRTSYTVLPWVGNVPFGYEPVSESEYRAATGDTQQYGASGYTMKNGVPYQISSLVGEAEQERLVAEGKLKKIPVGNGFAYATTESPEAVLARQAQGSTAQTLAEWYAARNETLPSVEDRGKLYEQYGIGIAAYYTGTAEQNAKLLSRLKGI